MIILFVSCGSPGKVGTSFVGRVSFFPIEITNHSEAKCVEFPLFCIYIDPRL